MTGTLYNINITIDHKLAESLEAFLIEQGALATTLHDHEDKEALFQQSLEESPLWQQTTVTAIFKANIFSAEMLTLFNQLEPSSPPLTFSEDPIEDNDWVSLTQEQFQAQCYNESLWVQPSWDTTDRTGQTIYINPGLAFGTGTHPTTQLCLDWLAKHPPKDINMIDYGCGSGILALAGAALGAKKVWAVDHDPQAIESSLNNIALNPTLANGAIQTSLSDDFSSINCPLIIANILANPLITLKPTLKQHLEKDGQLLLSGLLETDIDRITAAYQDDFTIIDITTQDEWARMLLQYA